LVVIPTRDFSDRAAWEKGFAEIGGPGSVLLSDYSPDPTWAGKTLEQLSKQTGKDAVTLAQEILAKTANGAGRQSVVVTAMREDDLRRFVSAPDVMFCTDGGLKPSHPRGAGAFPRVFARYVREQRALSLEAAVHKATALPARRMGFADRGIIAPGKRADLVLFDPARVRDTATVQSPTSPPEGIPHVLVSGVPVVRDGKVTGERPGQVLRRG
jgi:N-acyl-D-amino-acid deacylase